MPDQPSETRALSGIAAAVSLTMFAQLAISTVETLIVARLGAVPLAGTVLALSLFQLLFLAALGVVTAVTPIAAASAGSGDVAAIRRTAQQGVLIALVISLPGMLAMLIAAWIGLSSDDAVTHQAARYLAGAAWGLPAWVVYVALRCLAIATGQVGITTRALLVVMPLHAAATLFLVFVADLGVFGAGLGASLAGFAIVGVLAATTRWSPDSAFAQALRPPYRRDRATTVAIFRLGIPFAARILLREGLLPAAALALAAFGPASLAAHAVAVRVIELAGIGAFGFSDATNMRVSHAIGAGHPARARHAALVGLLLSTVTGALLALMIALAAQPLARWILGSADPAVPAAAALLPIAALLLFAEAVQSAAGGALAGLRDARGPLVITILAAWLIGFPAGLALTRLLPAAQGMWTGLLGGAALSVGLTLLRLHRRMRVLPRA